MGLFLLWFVGLARACSLHIINRNHSNTFLLINQPKTKNLSKLKYWNKGCLFGYGHVTLDRFFRNIWCLFYWYANKQAATLIKKSLGNSSLLRLVQKKNTPGKFPFIVTNNWMVLVARWFVKYFFAPNFPILPRNRGEEDEENRQMQSVSLFKQN